ncbi:MAG TPA: cytochrome C oxidase subunit IV family protein [Bryobacteraceae bacterium]|nr:cytochrome C oxidase subunit IV family protein [Bryobacteraceae bacterium]
MANHSDHAEHAGHPVVPVRTYVIIWLALLGCTGLTYGVALIDLGPWNIVVALMIAFFKMSLVVLFFMHVKQENNLTRLFVAGGFVWLLILLALTLNDYMSRGWLPEGHIWRPGP